MTTRSATRPVTPGAPPRRGPGRPLGRRVAAPRYRLRRAVAAVLLVVSAGGVVAALGLLSDASRAQAPGMPPARTQVAVAPGDTLWDLARRAAPDAETAVVAGRIAEENGLSSARLAPGQVLWVPAAG